jgi:hypothetical protein
MARKFYGSTSMLPREEAHPDLPPIGELPPATGQMRRNFIGKWITVPGFDGEMLAEFSRRYALRAIDAYLERHGLPPRAAATKDTP